MSSSSVTKTAGYDRIADRLVPEFDEVGSDDRWRVEELRMSIGAEPDICICVIPKPQGTMDFPIGDLLFNETGPYGNILVGRRVSVKKITTAADGTTKSLIVWNGTVVHVGFEWGETSHNCLVAVAYDDRWLLQKVRVIGRWCRGAYQQRWPAHFNPGGRPNCLYDAFGIPEFAPYPDFGLEDGIPPRPPKDKDVSLASYWTYGMILSYLRSHLGPTASIPSAFPWLNRCPATITWPVGFGSNIDTAANAFFDSGIGTPGASVGQGRKGRDLIAEGRDLCSLFTEMLETAGGWALALIHEPGGSEAKSILTAVPTRYDSDETAVSMPIALSGNASDSLATAALTSGSWGEDGTDFCTTIIGAGQRKYIERRLTGPDPDDEEDAGEIIEAWDPDREARFLQLAAGQDVEIQVPVVAEGNISYSSKTIAGLGVASEEAWDQACSIFPEVYTTYKLREGFDFQADSTESAMPRAEIARPILPRQLSFVSDNLAVMDFGAYTAPVYVEIRTPAYLTDKWQIANAFSGLEVWEDGTIYMPGLRILNNVPRNWDWHSYPWVTHEVSGKTQLYVDKQRIRMNVAIPCDHGLIAGLRNSADAINDGNILSADNNPDQPRIAQSIVRRDYIDTDLYAHWQRASSYPLPASAGFEQAQNAVLRNDVELFKAHIARKMYEANRLRKSGFPRMDGHLVTSYKPGQKVKSFKLVGGGEFPVRSVIRAIKLVCQENAIYTEFEFI